MSRVTHIERVVLAVILAALMAGAAPAAAQPSPRSRSVRRARSAGSASCATARAARRLAQLAVRWCARYETVVRRYPTSGYCDNALWQGGELSRCWRSSDSSRLPIGGPPFDC